MPFIIEFAVCIIIATVSVALGAIFIGGIASSKYRGTYDPEGNSVRPYLVATKYLCTMAAGIAGAIKLPSVIEAAGKAIATIVGSQ